MALLQVRGPPPSASAAPWRDRAAASVRAGLRSAVAGLPPDERGLVPGLVLGDTSGVGADLTADFRSAGLTHVLAVSGSNLALLLGAVLALARKAGTRLRLLPLIALVTVVVFVLVARPEPSLLRAAVMGMVGVVGLAAGRGGRAMPSLCAATVALLLVDPWLARSYGFALSVFATAGLILLAPAWRDRLAMRMPRPLATAIAVPAAAQAACAPVLVLLTAQLGLAAVPANLLAVPAVAPAMFLGVLATLSWPVCPPVARLCGDLAGVPAWWIVTVARHAAAVPGATVPWAGGPRGALALALLTAALVLFLGRRRVTGPIPGAAVGPGGSPGGVGLPGGAGSPRPAASPGAPPISTGAACGGRGGRRAVRRRWHRGVRRLRVTLRQIRPLALVAAGLAVLLLFRPPVSLPRLLPSAWPPRGWVFVVCDVGQGDGLVLNAGPGAAVVVDTGPNPAAMDACLRRLGVRSIPYLLLTHFHADHVEGLPGVLHGRRVGEIGVSPLPDPPAEVNRVSEWAGRIPVTHPSPGEQRVTGGLRWRVLWPSRLIMDGSPPNNASVVLLVEVAGIRILLTGDIEPPAQDVLHRAEPGLRADVLKIPHHGSANQDPDFLLSLGARIAIASAGVNNDYGHPAPSTLRLLEGAGMRVARTDRDGDVAVVVRDGHLAVATRR